VGAPIDRESAAAARQYNVARDFEEEEDDRP